MLSDNTFITDDLIWDCDIKNQQGLVCDEMYAFEGRSSWGPGMCRLKIWHVDDLYVAMITDLPGNPGTPVSFVFRKLASDVVKKYFHGISLDRIRWIDHIPVATRMPYAEISMQWDGDKESFVSGNLNRVDERLLGIIGMGIAP